MSVQAPTTATEVAEVRCAEALEVAAAFREQLHAREAAFKSATKPADIDRTHRAVAEARAQVAKANRNAAEARAILEDIYAEELEQNRTRRRANAPR